MERELDSAEEKRNASPYMAKRSYQSITDDTRSYQQKRFSNKVKTEKSDEESIGTCAMLGILENKEK